MSDAADRASEREAGERDRALTAHRARAAETPFQIQGRRVCLDCFEPIPRQRLRAIPDAARCIECQTDHEAMTRRLAHGMV